MRCEGADERQVAVLLGVVEPVADDELVRDVEADVPDVDVDLRGSGLRSSAATSTDAGPRVRRFDSSQDRVSPESMMSSTMSTCGR